VLRVLGGSIGRDQKRHAISDEDLDDFRRTETPSQNAFKVIDESQDRTHKKGSHERVSQDVRILRTLYQSFFRHYFSIIALTATPMKYGQRRMAQIPFQKKGRSKNPMVNSHPANQEKAVNPCCSTLIFSILLKNNYYSTKILPVMVAAWALQ